MGGSVYQSISRHFYIDPQGYAKLSLSEKYEMARLVGKLNKMIGKREKMPTILLGPGRWGTTTPAMGVPVTFSEINNIAAIGEIAYNDGSLVPDLIFRHAFFSGHGRNGYLLRGNISGEKKCHFQSAVAYKTAEHSH